MDFLSKHIEALIFCAGQPISVADIQGTLKEMFEHDVPEQDVTQAIEKLTARYASEDYAFEVHHVAGGYQFLTKPAYQASIGILLKQKSKKRLSTSALETLAIIAYKQPVTKAQVEQIRGVNCDYAIHKLLEKELINIQGKAESVGRPLLYGTSDMFMEYFGINSLKDLPTPKEFMQDTNSIGNESDEG